MGHEIPLGRLSSYFRRVEVYDACYARTCSRRGLRGQRDRQSLKITLGDENGRRRNGSRFICFLTNEPYWISMRSFAHRSKKKFVLLFLFLFIVDHGYRKTSRTAGPPPRFTYLQASVVYSLNRRTSTHRTYFLRSEVPSRYAIEFIVDSRRSLVAS